MNSYSPIRILWDGGHLLAVDKPADLSTQAPPGGDSLEARLRGQLLDRSGYLAIVHRLDRSVGGVMLVALRKKEARLISEQFATRKIEKRYAAVVAGRVDDGQTRWRDFMRKIPDVARAEICDAAAEGAKPAETRVRIRWFDPVTSCSHLDLFPTTGRMHQLRIQCAARGVPIVGDMLYGGPESRSESRSELRADGAFQDDGHETKLMLRAESIEFHDPRSGKRVRVDADPLCPPPEPG